MTNGLVTPQVFVGEVREVVVQIAQNNSWYAAMLPELQVPAVAFERRRNEKGLWEVVLAGEEALRRKISVAVETAMRGV